MYTNCKKIDNILRKNLRRWQRYYDLSNALRKEYLKKKTNTHENKLK